MEQKKFIYGASVVIIIVVIVAALQLNYLNNKVTSIEGELNDLESDVSQKNDIIESLSQQIEDNERVISELEVDLRDSELKNEEYLEKIYLLNTTLLILGGDVSILDQLVGSVGPDEIGVVLRAYGEKVLELENLRKNYEELLAEYNLLLKQSTK